MTRAAIDARTSTDELSAFFAARLLDPQRRRAFIEALGRLIATSVLREIEASTRSECMPTCATPREKGRSQHRERRRKA